MLSGLEYLPCRNCSKQPIGKKTLKLKVLAYHAVLLRSQKQTNETTKQEDVTKKKRKENKKTLNKAGLFRIEKS